MGGKVAGAVDWGPGIIRIRGETSVGRRGKERRTEKKERGLRRRKKEKGERKEEG